MSTTIDQSTPRVQNGAPPSRTAVAVVESDQTDRSLAAFASVANFEVAQRIARMLSHSTIVPDNYRGDAGMPNCMIALELASRTGASVFMVMQNLHVIKGRPSWSAAFLISSVNTCKRFSPIRYQWRGEKGDADWACRAIAIENDTGEVLEGEWITWEMVKAEGWLNKDGSKWKTMPGQMFRYRAASFWCRTYAPEISLGMHSVEEAEDIGAVAPAQPSRGARDLNNALNETIADAEVVEITNAEPAAPAAVPAKKAAASPAPAPTSDAAAPAKAAPKPAAVKSPAAPATETRAPDLEHAGRKCFECNGMDGNHTTACPYYDGPDEP